MLGQERPCRKTNGQALVELAIMVPFLVIAMMGFLDLGRAFYFQISLTNAVREATRVGIQNAYYGLNASCDTPPAGPGPYCPVPTDATICSRVQQELNGTGFTVTCPDDVTVSPDQTTRVNTWLGVSTYQTQYSVKVTGVYRFNFITPIIGNLIGNPLTLTTSATMRTDY